MADVSDGSAYIIKNLCSETKGMQEKDSVVCEGYIDISVPRGHSLASLGKPRDARQ